VNSLISKVITALFSILLLILQFQNFLQHPGLSSIKLLQPNQEPFADCEELRVKTLSDDGWVDFWLNPVFSSIDQVDEMVETISGIKRCLDSESFMSSAINPDILLRMKYFLVFVAGESTPPSETSLSFVNLETSPDPAVKLLRDEAGFDPPNGFIFVRKYASRDSMPGIVRRFFLNDSVSGVTVFGRYIAILEENEIVWPLRALKTLSLPETISHELIHAYVISSQGSTNQDPFPRWFQEGVAIYLSGSNHQHSIFMPDFSVRTTSPKDYEDFGLIFDYLEGIHGRKKFLTMIHKALDEGDEAILYRDLDIADYNELLTNAYKWRLEKFLFRAGVAVLIFLLAGLFLYNRLPDIRCEHCGFTGKKKEFADGHCPECQYPIQRINNHADRV